jgi:hypothetical protein
VFFQKRVILPLVPFLPTMGALADADDEPRVGVCGAVGTSDEVVSLQNQRAILTKAAAVMARIVTEYTAAITNDDNITHEFLDLVLKFRGV